MEKNRMVVYGDDDYRKTLERARNITQRKNQEEGLGGTSPPRSLIRRLASVFNLTKEGNYHENPPTYEESSQEENKQIVFTDMEEFLHVHLFNPDDGRDVFVEEKDNVAVDPTQEPKCEKEEEDETKIHEEEGAVSYVMHDEVAIGKGLTGALNLLKQRGELKEEETMDKKTKKNKIVDDIHEKEIVIIRRDENGRDLTHDPKQAFKVFSHRFHGKVPGKKKQEKRMKQEEMKMKMKTKNNAEDTPSSSSSSSVVERMREAQAQLKSPYLVLSGNVKPGKIRDHRSTYGLLYDQTAQASDLNWNLTPMLGDRKVEFFLGKNRKSESGEMGPPKKPKSEK